MTISKESSLNFTFVEIELTSVLLTSRFKNSRFETSAWNEVWYLSSEELTTTPLSLMNNIVVTWYGLVVHLTLNLVIRTGFYDILKIILHKKQCQYSFLQLLKSKAEPKQTPPVILLSVFKHTDWLACLACAFIFSSGYRFQVHWKVFRTIPR